MTHPLYIAFIWHQHQPIYKSQRVNEYRLPWVRLHGTKDYLDLILHLERFPKLHQTVNLVPSLILQLEDYANGTAVDHYQQLALTPVQKLNSREKREIIDHFFDANYQHLISPHQRYRELFFQKQEKGLSWCLEHWQDDDYGDLLAWHNLAWIDPVFWDDPQIAQWLNQGQNFNLQDRSAIIAKQREIIQRIVPQHRLMQQTGQLEITTSPYTHPILPLLADSRSARVAIPDLLLPEQVFQWPEDIKAHLSKASEIYKDRFGKAPRGLWPSEQSVSPAILPYIAQEGFQWICSDEAVLGCSLNHFFARDESGNLYDPHLLYRPYLLETKEGNISIVFRDHRLSDLIGFSYGCMDAQEAAADLIGHLDKIALSLQEHQGGPFLVTIALDGENCWEFYEKDGLNFLNALYQRFSDHPGLKLVTVSEFLEKFPPQTTIATQNLHSGSWIDGTFTTWIGQQAKNKAWQMLIQARKVLEQHSEATEQTNPLAWEALYAAEGSDWFWWFGIGHSSHNDDTFDLLFRENLITLYEALGEPVPENLYLPIELHLGSRGHQQPLEMINPNIDGSADEQIWDKAGCIEIGGSRGTMHRNSLVQRLFYGYNHLNFFLRIDFQVGAHLPEELHIFWYYPDIANLNSPISLKAVPADPPLNHHYHHHLAIDLASQSIEMKRAHQDYSWNCCPTNSKAILDKCLEIAVPWSDLHIHPDTELHLVAILADAGSFKAHFPESGLLVLKMP
ncbi:MAG: glycoside hydrolase [Cyanobacteriota bacterium ELA615]